MEIILFLSVVVIFVLGGMFVFALSRAPEGEEVEGVGFVRKDGTK